MADRFYGVAVGGQLATDVTEAASTNSTAIELRVADSAYSNKQAVRAAVKAILMHLDTVETDPIA